MRRIRNVKLTKPSLRRAVLVGGAASTAYLLEQAIDMRAVPNRYDDLILWGGIVSRDPHRQKLLGALGHYTVGTLLAAAYEGAKPSLPRLPGWLRGLLFVQAENVLSFPSVAVISPIHPAVRRSTLPPLWTWRYFWLETARHAAYGIVLGLASQEAQP